MRKITPLRENVLGQMLEPPGTTQVTKHGIFLPESQTDEGSVRARWFKVTHVGPDQKAIEVDDYVLVPHGRWSRGIDINRTHREEDFIFLVDHNDILGKSKELPGE